MPTTSTAAKIGSCGAIRETPAPIVAGNPHLDQVIVAPRAHGLRGLLGDLRLAKQLRGDRYDLAIDFHGGPRASLLTWLSGAPDRLGYDVVGVEDDVSV